jgi:hypothetical protein
VSGYQRVDSALLFLLDSKLCSLPHREVWVLHSLPSYQSSDLQDQSLHLSSVILVMDSCAGHSARDAKMTAASLSGT